MNTSVLSPSVKRRREEAERARRGREERAQGRAAPAAPHEDSLDAEIGRIQKKVAALWSPPVKTFH